jgi:hypothetical protein
MDLKNLKIGQTVVTSGPADKAYVERAAKAKKAVPHLWKAIVEMFHGKAVEIDSIDEIHWPDGSRKIYFLQEPGHGWYLDEQGKIIGEEDGGLEDSALAHSLANWSLTGKACSEKRIVS